VAEPYRLSYSKGPNTPELMTVCIGEVLDRTASLYPDKRALVMRHTGSRFTWSELRDEVERAARGLLALGVSKGDRVGIWATNCTEWVLIQFATAKIGAILVNINPQYRSSELDYVLKESECQTLILQQGFRDCDYVETLKGLAPELRESRSGALRSAHLPNLRDVIFLGRDTPEGFVSWDELIQRGEGIAPDELRQRMRSLDPKDPINIQYTSGTTGFPKGATLSHYNVVNNALLIGNSMRLGSSDAVCIPVPFYHCFGMVLGNMTCVVHGAAMVIPAAHFDPLETLRAVHEERCTGLYGVPTMFIAELNHPEFKTFDLASLRTGIMAGSTCPIELMRRVVDEMHCPELTIAYGLTEASPVITQTSTDDVLDVRVKTVGRVLPSTEVKIIDADTSKIVPRGAVGELCTRGYLVMKGYYRDERSTRQAIDAEGWLHTGDLASMDDEGFIRIVGRSKDMIIRGGENIYPREIEEFLHTCPGVIEAQVVGVPDAKYGEEVMAWIKLDAHAVLTEDDIKQFCRGKIARFKVPRHVRFVDSFPMTVSGKVQKFRMRDEWIAESAAAINQNSSIGADA